jgi:sulfoxide reductase heme-binding subunit YedZ
VKSDPTFWIVARASGLTAYALLTVTVLLGLLVKSRPFGKAIDAAGATGLHRFLSLVGLGMLGLHGLALVADRASGVRLLDLVVPGLASYRPVWTAAGVLAAELMALVVASFSLRRRLGARTWRRLHYLTFGVFAAATAHGLAAGSDTHKGWALGLYVAATASVAGATVWRLLVPPPRPARPRPRSRATDQGGTRDAQVSRRDRPVAV